MTIGLGRFLRKRVNPDLYKFGIVFFFFFGCKTVLLPDVDNERITKPLKSIKKAPLSALKVH